MKKLNKKKGFTIVELVIVIAVVGVLTAVLVPTFVNLANQARKAENQTFVKNLNTQMAIREATEGKNKTMYEAVMEAEDIGFNVEKLTPFDGNDIVWDSVANRFAIVAGDYATSKTVVYAEGEIKATSIHQLWKIYDSLGAVPEAEAQTYSVYAKEGWDLTGLDSKVFAVGFDAGKNKTIGHETKYARQATTSSLRESISGKAPRMLEENGQEVTIRTTGGTLTVDAPADAVRHYGEAQIATLKAVGANSYYEHGFVNLADIKKGRLVITNDAEAEVGTIYLTATNDSYDGIILATQNGSELPDVVAREAVSNPETGEKLVVTIQTNVDANGENPAKTEQIYLYPASDVKEATKGYNVSDLGLLVVEAISSEAQTQAANQITDTAILESVKESNVTTKEEVVAAATEFAGGKGTKASPWLIDDYDTMQAISNHYNDDVQRYFKVKEGITEIDCSNWNSVNLYGHFDGNGVTFKNVDDILFKSIYQNASSDETAVIKNFSIEAYIVRSSYSSALAYSVGEKVDFSNINVTGYIEGSYAVSFVSFGPWQFDDLNIATWTFNNCNSSAMLCGTDGTAGFVNHSYCAAGSTAHLVNSKFTGEMRIVKLVNTTSKNDYYGGTDGHITGEINAYNVAYYFQCMGNIAFTEEFTDGTDVNTLHYNKWTNKTTQGTAQSDVLCIRDRVSLAPLTNVDQLNTNGVSTVTVNATNDSVTHAKAVLYIGPNDAENETGGYYGAWLTEELALNNGQFTTNTIKTFKIAINGLFYDWTDNTWKEPAAITDKNTSGIYGDYYNMALSSFYGRTYAQKSVTIIQYNSLNQVVSKTSVNFAVSTSLSVIDYTGNHFNANGTVKGITADKRAVLGMSYSLVLQDPTLTAEELVVKHGSDVLIANTDYTVENGVLNIKASAIKQSTYKERNITVNRKLNVTLNGEEQDGILNQVTCYINIADLTTKNKSGLTVKINNVVIAEGSGRYTVEKGRIKVDAKVLTGDVDITFSISE